MSTPKAVVIGVDDSWQRAGAVEWALDEALRSGAPIHVVHVVDDTYTKRPDETPDAALEQAHGLVRTVRGHIDRSAPRVVAVDTTTPVGRPGPMLAAEAAQARMLVVGR